MCTCYHSPGHRNAQEHHHGEPESASEAKGERLAHVGGGTARGADGMGDGGEGGGERDDGGDIVNRVDCWPDGNAHVSSSYYWRVGQDCKDVIGGDGARVQGGKGKEE